MESARDDVYCLEIARRAVARAALRLGIKAMSEECLNVLGDILLTYLQRIGQKLSYLVESSNRTSAHVNVLDTLQAVELCTSPAVQRMHIMGETMDGMMMGELFGGSGAGGDAQQQQQHQLQSSSSSSTQQPLTWQGLAEFCFGPDWYKEITKEEQQQIIEERRNRVSRGGGKEGPVSAENDINHKGNHILDDDNNTATTGWVAPYPDEIPHFPQSSWDTSGHNQSNNNSNSNNDTRFPLTANPHNLPPSVAQSLHSVAIDEEDQKQQQPRLEGMDAQDGIRTTNSYHHDLQVIEKQLKSLPDEAFTATWGSIGTRTSNDTTTEEERTETNKRKHYQFMDEERKRTLNVGAGAGDSDAAAAAGGTVSATASVTSDSPAKKKPKLGDTDANTAAAGTTTNTTNTTEAAKDTSAKTGNQSNTNKNAAGSSGTGKDDANASSNNNNTANNNSKHPYQHKRYKNNNNPSYIPSFYPKLPRARTSLSGRTVLDFDYQDNDGSNNNEAEEQRRQWLLQQQQPQYQQQQNQQQQQIQLQSRLQGTSNSGTETTAAAGAAGAAGAATGSSAMTTDAAFGLRSALVQLNQSYWGSGWDAAPEKEEPKKQVRVPLGRNANERQPGIGGGADGGLNSSTNANGDNSINPLLRASGSRVSRILEGSMDAATMQ